MDSCLKSVNNCLELFTSCVPKDNNNTSTNNNSSNKKGNDDENSNLTTNNNSTNPPEMNNFFTLLLPVRPKVDDEIRIQAKLKERPKE
jgi:hypothetical protein